MADEPLTADKFRHSSPTRGQVAVKSSHRFANAVSGMSLPEIESSPAQDTSAFELKAGHYTLPSLRIREDDLDALDGYLARRVAQMPQFFDQAPLVLDVEQYPVDNLMESFPAIVGMIRGHGMVPVGVRGASPEQQEQAKLLELAVMPQFVNGNVEKPADDAVETPGRVEPMIVDQPVRSGQRIYAEGRDLILTAGVGSGAEVMADGHIHAYGPIRGRALAGVCDNPDARIFCAQLAAELVAIAGRYRVSEDLPAQHLGRAVQISLDGEALQFASL